MITPSVSISESTVARQEAFILLVTQCAPRMLAVARRILRNESDMADVLQDAYLQAFRAWEDFRGEADPQTWIYRIVVRMALARQKKLATVETSMDQMLPTYYADGHRVDPWDPWPSAAGELEIQELRHLVRAKIQELPDTLRQVTILRDIEEFDTRQTAEMLEISEELVKVRLHRARQALRTLLDPHMRDMT